MSDRYFYLIVFLVVIGIGGGFVAYSKLTTKESAGQYDAFAQCLSTSGTKFYGAFWCSHCQRQKALFGKSLTYVPYIECSTPDGQRRTDVCTAAGIEGYPTWVFADGTRLSGELTLEAIAENSGCSLDGTVTTKKEVGAVATSTADAATSTP